MLIPNEQLWMVVTGFAIAFALAFGIGANDVANTFGSSVGSKVLTLKQACTLATICELAGAILLGSKVSSTLRKGIVDPSLFGTIENGARNLMAGQLAALGASCIWMLLATFFRKPVSGSHSIVGATMGFSIVLFGAKAINWMSLAKIIASWFISPVLSGLISVGIFAIIHYIVLIKDEPLEPALRLLPGFYGSMVVVNIMTILLDGSEAFQFNRIPIYGVFILSCAGGTFTVIYVKRFMLPRLRKRILADQDVGWGLWDKLSKAVRCGNVNCFRRRVKHTQPSMDHTTNSSTAQLKKPLDSVCDDHPEVIFSTGCATVADRDSVSPSLSINAIRALGDTLENGTSAGWKNRNSTNNPTLGDAGNTVSTTTSPVAAIKPTHRTFDVRPTVLHQSEQPSTKQGNQVATTYTGSGADSVEHSMSVTKRRIAAQTSLPAIGEEEPEGRELVQDRPAEAKVFWLLQVMSSVLGSFAHGGNDVSNAVGPLMGLWIVGITQDVDSKMTNPYWILVYGGVGISIGLWVWGRRVIQTLGEDLTKITPSSGVCIEIGSALTALLASKLGLPVSTTHCQVGSVIAVGRFRSRDNVKWVIFRDIIIAWVVTVPVTCGLSALLMYVFTLFI